MSSAEGATPDIVSAEYQRLIVLGHTRIEELSFTTARPMDILSKPDRQIVHRYQYDDRIR
ncbi:MAG: hypothetical protein BGN87_11730 [Rhizobiales bacterium 65-79]|nr:MAG: hypothetical protein BGN87_11730 [Rhizobiales bacterium 65-79]